MIDPTKCFGGMLEPPDKFGNFPYCLICVDMFPLWDITGLTPERGGDPNPRPRGQVFLGNIYDKENKKLGKQKVEWENTSHTKINTLINKMNEYIRENT